jgi:hypothetical protein
MARILDTKHLESFYATTALLPELAATGICEIVRPAAPIAFDVTGRLADDLTA